MFLSNKKCGLIQKFCVQNDNRNTSEKFVWNMLFLTLDFNLSKHDESAVSTKSNAKVTRVKKNHSLAFEILDYEIFYNRVSFERHLQ